MLICKIEGVKGVNVELVGGAVCLNVLKRIIAHGMRCSEMY